MKNWLVAGALLVGASTASAQTIRTVSLQVVFETYTENRAHWANLSTVAQQLATEDSTYWHGPHASWGALVLAPTIFPAWVDSSQSMANGCSVGQLLADTDAAMGPVPGNTIRAIILPPGTPCNSEAIGGIVSTGAGVYFITVGGSFIEHETGHSLGLFHGWMQHCSTAGGCWSQEYSWYTVMGTSTHSDGLNIQERMLLNVYSPTFRLATVTTSQDVTLQYADTATPGIKGLTIPLSVKVPKVIALPPPLPPITTYVNEDHTLDVELRSGDVILWGYPNRVLLDLDRTTATDRYPMNVGETYCDVPLVCVTLLAHDATTATVHVSFDMSAVPPPPPPPAPLSITVVSPAPGASFPVGLTNATTGAGFQAVVTATGAASVVVHFGPSGNTSVYTCGPLSTPYYACVVSGTAYTFTIKTGLAPGPRVLWFDAVDANGKTLSTPPQGVTITQ